MSNYAIEVTRAVEKDLDSLKHLRAEAVEKILKLENEPKKKSSALKGNLKGLYSYKFNLSGAGSFRAIYSIKEEDEICLLIIVASRENIYIEADKRYKLLKKQNLIKD
ncbi:type II toxin-antitoxin system RelE/ParE family toxin [Natroniella acetigena]|uniref:type II toxin-antitoxin system RelE family toxin n=1 Tax=Natroniella acetigena TaxID=52004 RepID=UPI00200AAA35|nr:type II toxin-antitoxin system RelE/ParE family toxin [Natroniella acetigena]MCK8827038.1 type II toxin-antitoxin system RelE/ParE family toxin [Natroniella acetigena]